MIYLEQMHSPKDAQPGWFQVKSIMLHSMWSKTYLEPYLKLAMMRLSLVGLVRCKEAQIYSLELFKQVQSKWIGRKHTPASFFSTQLVRSTYSSEMKATYRV